MELDPSAWVVHRHVVDAPVGDDLARAPVPTSSFAAELERDLIRLEELGVLVVSDEVTAAG
jgi:hypothetical protein